MPFGLSNLNLLLFKRNYHSVDSIARTGRSAIIRTVPGFVELTLMMSFR